LRIVGGYVFYPSTSAKEWPPLITEGPFHHCKRAFDESQVRFSAHIRGVGPPKLSAKGRSPVQVQRKAFAESKLSVKPSPRGIGPSPRGSQLSAKTVNPVVIAPTVARATVLAAPRCGHRAIDTGQKYAGTGWVRCIPGNCPSGPGRATAQAGLVLKHSQRP
jgi:hypothetical protein